MTKKSPFRFASSLLHYDIIGYVYEDAIKDISKAGYEGIELHSPPPPHTKNGAPLRRLLRRLDLETATVTCQRWAWAHKDGRKVKETLDTFKEAVLLAEYLDSERVMTETGFVPEGMSRDDAVKMAAHKIAEGADFAADHGIETVIVETDPHYIVENSTQFLEFMKLVGASNVYPNVDGSNYLMVDEDPAQVILKYGPLLRGIHIKDGKREPGGWTPMGEGDVDWREFLTNARKVGYDGWLVTEYEGGIRGRYYSDPEKASRDTLAYLKRLIRTL